MMRPRMTRHAYPRKRLRSGNDAPPRDMFRYASCNSVVAPIVTPLPRRASSRLASRCSSAYSAENSASAAARSPRSAEASSVVMSEVNGREYSAPPCVPLHADAKGEPVLARYADAEIRPELRVEGDELRGQGAAALGVKTFGQGPRRSVTGGKR